MDWLGIPLDEIRLYHVCRVCKEMGAFQEMKEDVLLHVSHLFNPLHLFLFFLAEASVSYSDYTNILSFIYLKSMLKFISLHLLHYVLFIFAVTL